MTDERKEQLQDIKSELRNARNTLQYLWTNPESLETIEEINEHLRNALTELESMHFEIRNKR